MHSDTYPHTGSLRHLMYKNQRVNLPTDKEVQACTWHTASLVSVAGTVKSLDYPFCTHLISELCMNDLREGCRDQGGAGWTDSNRRSMVPRDPCRVPSEAPRSPPTPSTGCLPQASSFLVRLPSPGGSSGPAGGFIPTTSETALELLSLAASLFHK